MLFAWINIKIIIVGILWKVKLSPYVTHVQMMWLLFYAEMWFRIQFSLQRSQYFTIADLCTEFDRNLFKLRKLIYRSNNLKDLACFYVTLTIMSSACYKFVSNQKCLKHRHICPRPTTNYFNISCDGKYRFSSFRLKESNNFLAWFWCGQ